MELSFQNKAPFMSFAKDGVSGHFDIIDGKFDYKGDLPVGDAAKLLFEQVAKLVGYSGTKTPETRCEGCGSKLTSEELQAKGYRNCCPERKPLTIDQWREKSNNQEQLISDLRAALTLHHNWHLQSGTIGIKADDGEWIELDNAGKYSDSALYDETAKLLPNFSPFRKPPVETNREKIDELKKLSDKAQSGPYFTSDNLVTHTWILGEPLDDDQTKLKYVARAPVIRKHDTDGRRQWRNDRKFIVACVNFVRDLLAEKRKLHVGRNIYNDADWRKLADMLGLDGWHDGIYHGPPSIQGIITHIEHINSERWRLTMEALVPVPVVRRYEDIIYKFSPTLKPECRPDPGTGLAHLLWMLQEIRENKVEGTKAHRWLAFVQAVLIMHQAGLATVQSERDFTRPYFSRKDKTDA